MLAAALLALLLCVSVFHVSSAADPTSCYNADFTFSPTNWSDALESNSSARLYLAKSWTSKKVPNLPVTVATHGNVARDKHINQCRTWHGPIVAAMYLPLIQAGGSELNNENKQTVLDTILHLDKIHDRIERHRKCQLTILLFWEVFSSTNDSWLYPTNDMRNLALTQARTPMVAMIDIDLLISISLSTLLADPSKAQAIQRICDNKGVVSLAAFQFPTAMNVPLATRLVDRLVRGTKADIIKMVRGRHHLIPFAEDVFPMGHNVTNYTRWYSATEPYQVQYQWHYEPWYIINRRSNPPYDTTLRAYFYNKVMHAAHVNSTGVHIMVHPEAFIMHRPHPVSRVYSSRALFDTLHSIMYRRSEEGKALMAQGAYQPAGGTAATRCQAELPWWTDPTYDYQDPSNWAPAAPPSETGPSGTGQAELRRRR